MKKLLYNNKLGIAITCFGIFLLWVNGRIFFVWGDHSTPRIAAMFFAISVILFHPISWIVQKKLYSDIMTRPWITSLCVAWIAVGTGVLALINNSSPVPSFLVAAIFVFQSCVQIMNVKTGKTPLQKPSEPKKPDPDYVPDEEKRNRNQKHLY